jgi:hypothetical protein
MSLQRSLIAHDHRPILDRQPSRIRFATGTGLMETAERDFRRGLLQELMTAEKATDDDIAAEIDKFKP